MAFAEKELQFHITLENKTHHPDFSLSTAISRLSLEIAVEVYDVLEPPVKIGGPKCPDAVGFPLQVSASVV